MQQSVLPVHGGRAPSLPLSFPSLRLSVCLSFCLCLAFAFAFVLVSMYLRGVRSGLHLL